MRTFDQITEMPPRWAKAMTLRSEGHTYQAIGNELGVTANRAWQIVRAAKRRAPVAEGAAKSAGVLSS